MTLLNTTLQIVRGVFKAPGDNFSAENDLFILELQDPQGFSLQVDGWSPNLPALKGGGTWAESAIADGRTPLALTVGNVMETMRLTMANGDLQQRFAIFKKLGQMRQSMIDFWDGTAQIDPVYIRWHAAIGKGEQYALIYNLEMAQDTDIFNPEQAWDVTLTMEREPYWRGIWPGGNPKEWTLGVVRGLVRGQARYQTANMDLTSDSDHFLFETINNKFEWTPAATGSQTTFITKNYIEIPADTVPGDAPALLELSMRLSQKFAGIGADLAGGQLYIGLSTKELNKVDHIGATRVQAYNLNGGDSIVSGVATKTSVPITSGVRSNNSAALFYDIRFVFAAAGNATIFWGINASGAQSIVLPDRELLRGTFLVFIRGHQESGSAGDVTLGLTVREDEGAWTAGLTGSLATDYTFPDVNAPLAVSGLYPLAYVGRLTLPLSTPSVVSPLGYGRQIRETLSNLSFNLLVTNHPAAARNYVMTDIILVPIDEGIVDVIANNTTVLGQSEGAMYIIDGTGYLTRGEPSTRAVGYMDTNESDAVTGGVSIEVRGDLPRLIPGKRQRLYFLWTIVSEENTAAVDATTTVRANIIPRWSGIRDV